MKKRKASTTVDMFAAPSRTWTWRVIYMLDIRSFAEVEGDDGVTRAHEELEAVGRRIVSELEKEKDCPRGLLVATRGLGTLDASELWNVEEGEQTWWARLALVARVPPKKEWPYTDVRHMFAMPQPIVRRVGVEPSEMRYFAGRSARAAAMLLERVYGASVAPGWLPTTHREFIADVADCDHIVARLEREQIIKRGEPARMPCGGSWYNDPSGAKGHSPMPSQYLYYPVSGREADARAFIEAHRAKGAA